MIYIVSVKNENSGSCVSVKRLSEILKDDVKFITSEGDFLEGDEILIDTELNPIKIFINIIILNFKLKAKKNDFILFNSIISAPYLLFYLRRAKRAILIHELGLNPKWLYNFIIFLLNFFNVKVAVVNPYMRKIYKNSYLLQNFYKPDNTHEVKKVDRQILKIANCNLKKGIKDYIKLAKNFPKFKFILLTQKHLMEPDCKEVLKNIPDNLIIEYNQSRKIYLLKSSKFLISLSLANETFGLVLLEAIKNGTLAISVENLGSKYCLNNNRNLIYKREEILNNFDKIYKELNKNYDKILKELQEYMNNEFSEKKIRKNFGRLLN